MFGNMLGAYSGGVRRSTPYWEFFLLLAARAKTGWHSNTVIRCHESLFSCVMDIYNFVGLDTGCISDSEYFWRSMALQIFRKLL